MSSPVQLRSQYSHLFGTSKLPVLKEMFAMEMAQWPSIREQIFKVEMADSDIYQITERHDMGLFQAVSEGTEFSYSRPMQGASKTFTMTKYGLGTSISDEMIADAKFSVIQDSIKKLARSAKETQAVQAMNVFNNGFSSETVNDGLALFHTAHTLPSGGTFRNRLSTDADLSVTSLDQMLTDFSTSFVGDGGVIYQIRPKTLLVPPALKRYAMELIGSELKADTAENNMNSFKQDGLVVVESPHLTDSDAWFLLGRPEETGLRLIKREEIKLESFRREETQSEFVQSCYREAIGAATAWGVFGTSGS